MSTIAHFQSIRDPSPSSVPSELSLKPLSSTPTSNLDDTHLSPHPTMNDKELYARRHSVDNGGLAISLGDITSGGEDADKDGWEDEDNGEASFAELLNKMFTQIQSMVSAPVLSSNFTIDENTRRRLIESLDSWNFEPHRLPDEEVLACTQILFEALFRIHGMREDIDVSLDQLDSFLRHLRQVYRSWNPYHNFQHALDVFQATHTFLRTAGVVPPVSIVLTDPNVTWKPDEPAHYSLARLLTKEDLFSLYIAAVGHDVGHPGFNNIFMKNAKTPLSRVYDHKSALEQMHCAFLIPIMKQHGLAHLLDRGKSGAQFRKLLFQTVIATDMGVHNQFMERFKKLVEQPNTYDIPQTRLLLCQALIKCADISNPSRPHTVSQHWSAALAAEWARQALLEKHLQLPISVQVSDGPLDEAQGQIFFIQTFALPLLEITAKAISEMKCFADQCAANCSLWKARMRGLTSNSQSNYPPVPYRSLSPPHPHDYVSVLPLSLPAELLASPEERPSAMWPFSSPTPSASVTSSATPSIGSRSSSPSAGHPSESIAAPWAFPPISTKQVAASISPPFSPSDGDTAATLPSPISPRSEIGGTAATPLSGIRAAHKDSIRKKKSFHRSSWTGSSSSSNHFHFPPNPMPPSSSHTHRSSPTPNSGVGPNDSSSIPRPMDYNIPKPSTANSSYLPLHGLDPAPNTIAASSFLDTP